MISVLEISVGVSRGKTAFTGNLRNIGHLYWNYRPDKKQWNRIEHSLYQVDFLILTGCVKTCTEALIVIKFLLSLKFVSSNLNKHKQPSVFSSDITELHFTITSNQDFLTNLRKRFRACIGYIFQHFWVNDLEQVSLTLDTNALFIEVTSLDLVEIQVHLDRLVVEILLFRILCSAALPPR